MLLLEKQVPSLYKSPLNSKHLHSQIINTDPKSRQDNPTCSKVWEGEGRLYSFLQHISNCAWIPWEDTQADRYNPEGNASTQRCGKHGGVLRLWERQVPKEMWVKELFQTPVSPRTSIMTSGASSFSHLEFHFCSRLVELTKPIYKGGT